MVCRRFNSYSAQKNELLKTVCFNDRWSLTPSTRMIIGVLAGFVEFEREIIKEKP
ncbi:hypothetical protein PEDI_54920 [Persicobacter diffluens]|uniref:Uncharacterized protein n=1 Tax=Persicobacter diffluens TaxID=981 RepID=A0AAN4W6F8_9BACT|nr:hypothetical protein PEDI_54920 [Persicobacter diffluens]